MYLQSAKSTKTASSKASISSFFSKPSSATKNKETAQPVAKEVGNSSNMFDDQFSADPMDVDQCEDKTDDKTEKQTKKQAEKTEKNNKKRSIVDVHGEDRILLLRVRSTYCFFSYFKRTEATTYPELLKRKKLRKSTRKHRKSRNTHVSSK